MCAPVPNDPHFIYSLELRIIDLEKKIVDLEKKIERIAQYSDAPVSEMELPEALKDRLKRGENRVRVFRTYRALTQQQLSEKSGIRANHISAIENGMRFGLKTARSIAKALEIPVSWLT
jgi:DNA-binding XRE family transcriptional regulator